ncbi:hypothetical protein, partial [Gardnerella vaginalis]|uniref:hypothetical protein n=1 Tax=Gardnerella vaginalis TaxID=2702 RepID=UPI003F597BD1
MLCIPMVMHKNPSDKVLSLDFIVPFRVFGNGRKIHMKLINIGSFSLMLMQEN